MKRYLNKFQSQNMYTSMKQLETQCFQHFVRTNKQISTCSTITVTSNRSIKAISSPSSTHQETVLKGLGTLLQRKINNKRRYCLQILKQFILFDQSNCSSSLISVDRFDPLLFSDELLHSLLKIMETQLINAKVWAFLNLKIHKQQAQLAQFESAVSRVLNQRKTYLKKASFQMIFMSGESRKRAFGVFKADQGRVQPQKKPQRMLDNYNMFSIAIVNPKPQKIKEEQYLKVQKQTKQYSSISRRTGAYSDFSQISIGREYTGSCCRMCCCSTCCCNDYNLWERIQYLKQLEEMAAELDEES